MRVLISVYISPYHITMKGSWCPISQLTPAGRQWSRSRGVTISYLTVGSWRVLASATGRSKVEQSPTMSSSSPGEEHGRGELLSRSAHSRVAPYLEKLPHKIGLGGGGQRGPRMPRHDLSTHANKNKLKKKRGKP